MKSTNNERGHFSMEDFEKGLMLAGYIMPNSISELNEREDLERYEEQLADKTKKVYFKRVVLAAEIASKLCNEPSLGRVKFQKLVYLCEHAAKMDLGNRYQKQAAGPFDNKFMHTIDQELKKNKWFLVQKIDEKNITRYKYLPLENSGNHKKYYDNYFKNEDDNIQYIIELFRKINTENTELATTIYACILELKCKNQIITKDALIKLFYDWSKEKKRFTETQIISSLKWLVTKNLLKQEGIDI